MNTKNILNPRRIRKIRGSFAFIQHRFLGDGFLSSLEKDEVLLYLFSVLAADRYGLSYYGDTRICKILNLKANELEDARNSLIQKDLILYKAPWVQVLDLPNDVIRDCLAPPTPKSFNCLQQIAETSEVGNGS